MIANVECGIRNAEFSNVGGGDKLHNHRPRNFDFLRRCNRGTFAARHCLNLKFGGKCLRNI